MQSVQIYEVAFITWVDITVGFGRFVKKRRIDWYFADRIIWMQELSLKIMKGNKDFTSTMRVQRTSHLGKNTVKWWFPFCFLAIFNANLLSTYNTNQTMLLPDKFGIDSYLFCYRTKYKKRRKRIVREIPYFTPRKCVAEISVFIFIT